MVKIAAMISPVERVIQAFGGIRPLAYAMDLDPSTVLGWKKRGRIPRWHHDRILQKARYCGLKLARSALGPRYGR